MSDVTRRLSRDKSGGVIVAMPFLMLVVAGFTGLAIDVGNLYYTKLKLQKITDNAAAGAVLFLPDPTKATSTATNLIGLNTPAGYGTVAKSTDIQLGTWDAAAKKFTVTSSGQNAVKVTAHRWAAAPYSNPVLTYFGGVLGKKTVDAQASSVAVRYGTDACVYALAASGNSTFATGGSSSISGSCGVQVNSSGAKAANTGGSSSVSVSKLCVTGNFGGNGWSGTPQLQNGATACPALADPLLYLAEPTLPATCTTSATLTPGGCYTGNITLSGTINLPPGRYYFKAASVSASSQTTINGTGVQIYLDATSSLNLTGGASVSLSASSAYNGVLIFGSRSASGTSVALGGNGSLSLNGTIYAPGSNLTLGGTSTLSITTGYIVANTVTTTGSSQIALNGFGSSSVTTGSLIKHSSLVQ